MIFHVLDVSTGDSFRGPLQQLDENPQEAPPDNEPFPSEAVAGMTAHGYFNQNLLSHVKLSLHKGVYEVSVSWRGEISNRVAIELY